MPLNRAAGVLLCSHFEGFLEDIFTEYVRLLGGSGVSVDRLPPKLRVAQVEPKLEEVPQAVSRQERFAKLEEVFNAAAPLWSPTRIVQPGDLDPSLVTNGFSNPWTSRIAWLFDFVDVKKQVEEISWRAASKRSVRTNIDKMVELRNDVAHGRVAVGIRKADVTRYRKYVVGFAKALDRILSRKFVATVGRPPW